MGWRISNSLPEKSLNYGDYVIRGEQAFCELLDVLGNQQSPSKILNLSYVDHEQIVNNDVRPLVQNLDTLGYPKISSTPTYFIEDNHPSTKDPQLNAFTYELTCSRGCPFTCSYCSSINLRRLYTKKGAYVRFRSVNSIISELKEAKEKTYHLRVVHFWDEIFNDQEEWISEFGRRYREEIGIPFNIWGHPLKIKENGTDIVDMAIRDGHLTKDQLDKIMYSSIKEQYDMYWGPAAMNIMHNNQVWIALIYLTQFKKLSYLVRHLKYKADNHKSKKFTLMVYRIMKKLARAKDLAHKARLAYRK